MDGSGTADQVDRAALSPGDSAAGTTHTRNPLTVSQRLQREGRWKDIEPQRNEMMRLARKEGMSKADAQSWVYGELDRMYPPPTHKNSPTQSAIADSARPDDGSIQGLSNMPATWPELPANASLSAEIAWVQANRLRIVTEQMGRATVVRLDQALSSAPSWAALGWLETSIRSYAKFVDVAAKASGTDDGEAGVIKRERMAIEEVRSLLDEMRADRRDRRNEPDPAPRRAT